MKLALALPAVSFSLALAAGCAQDPAPGPAADSTFTADAGPEALVPGVEVASAVLAELDGSGVSGTVTFREVEGALRARVRLEGLSPGEHGFHVHEGASCAPDSAGTPGGAAGGHLNPLVSPHGAPSAARVSRHAGDLGNVTAGPDGVVAGVVVDSLLALSGPTTVVGHAVVVHAGRDDLESQPGGDAGARVACGVVREGEPPAAPPDSTGTAPPDA